MSTNTENTTSVQSSIRTFTSYISKPTELQEWADKFKKNALLSFKENESYLEMAEHLKEIIEEKKQKLKNETQEYNATLDAEILKEEQILEENKTLSAKCKNIMDSLHMKFISICENCKGNISKLSISDKEIYNNYTFAKRMWNQANNNICTSCNKLFNLILNSGKQKFIEILSRR